MGNNIQKGKKVSQFHIDVVKENIDKIVSGELNTKEVIALINEKAIQAEEPTISDNGTVKRMVKIALEDKPDEIKKYEEILKHNTGRRSPKAVRRFLSQETEFEKQIVKEYLPKLISGEITFDILQKELQTSHLTVDKIIEAYYLRNDNEEGFKKYKEIQRKHGGVSLTRRKKAKEMRNEVEKYEIVSNTDFLSLTKEEQDKQIIMKIRQSKLQEEKNSQKRNALISKEATETLVKRIKDYFRSKNDYENKIENFSEQDINYMIFRVPAIIGIGTEKIEAKLKVLTSYDEIDEQTAYRMIKAFPSITGYSAERTKEILDILKKDNLIDHAIKRPICFMNSPALMYSLIQYAKERHKTDDLSNVTRTNIFLTNSAMKRLYGKNYEEIKQKYPYKKQYNEKDVEYTINGQDVGKATYNNIEVEKSDEAHTIIEGLTKEKQKKEEI